jgi:hypothetical protein
VAKSELPDPQANRGSKREAPRQARRKEINSEAAVWLHSPRQGGKSAAAAKANAELILPPGFRGDAGVEHFLHRYNTDPEFHAKIERVVQEALQAERDRIIFGPDGKEYVITTEDGLPATKAAAMLEEMREIRTWAEIERMALNEQERREAEERERVCIWCGKVCESVDALAVHEDDCA